MLPSPHFWFAGSALWTIGSFVLFAILGFAGIAQMTAAYRKLMYFGYAAAFVLFFLGWWQSAKQEESGASRDADFSALKAAIGKIADAVKINQVGSAQELAKEILKRLPHERRLEGEDERAFFNVAKSFCNPSDQILVTAANGNNEAQVYGTDFVRNLKRAGCVSDLSLPIPGLRPDIEGISIGIKSSVHSDADIPPVAIALAKALTAAHVKFSFGRMADNFFPNEQFVLVVGKRQ